MSKTDRVTGWAVAALGLPERGTGVDRVALVIRSFGAGCSRILVA